VVKKRSSRCGARIPPSRKLLSGEKWKKHTLSIIQALLTILSREHLQALRRLKSRLDEVRDRKEAEALLAAAGAVPAAFNASLGES
jgi:hypothetical protein